MARRARVEPVPNAPAAVADAGTERLLVVGDYHAGIEAGLRYERGVELPSNADERRQRLLDVIEQTDADRLVVLGDLSHRIGSVDGPDAAELDALYSAVVVEREVPITVALGNHDGGLSELWADLADVEILPQSGGLLSGTSGSIGVFHGHTWPDPELLSAELVCMAHEHPTVKLTDSVGGYRTEKAWLRGRLDRDVMAEGLDCEPEDLAWADPRLVVLPAFNRRSGGTWVNVDGEGFLAPFLPDALRDGELYLLDGTRLGSYQSV